VAEHLQRVDEGLDSVVDVPRAKDPAPRRVATKKENIEGAEKLPFAPGQWREQPPPQPGLSMNGRTVETLMRQVAAWHQSLGRLKGLPDGAYEKADFGGFTIAQSVDRKSIRWSIRQLRSARDLQLESEELRHCVASYHWSCAEGECTIWSLSRSDGGALRRCQTIEVDRTRTIVQCRGLANRDPSSEEWSVVNAWAREADLTISPYL